MRNFTISGIVGCGLLACASIAWGQDAQKSDELLRFEETLVLAATPRAEDPLVKGEPSDYFLTFSTAVSIPGVTLAAGTYVFRFPSGTGTGVVQVLEPDNSSEYTMFTTAQIQDSRRNLFSDAQVIMRRERQAGTPPAIKELYLPGRSIGYEFIYPKKTT